MANAWPQPLKDWVGKCMAQMVDSNRAEAQAEMKTIIAQAHSNQTLWTTDWAGIQLQSLSPKAMPTISSLKRKMNDNSPLLLVNNKKAKKNAQKNGHQANGPASFDPSDQVALNRRAQRFQREHDIERQKNTVSFNKTGNYQYGNRGYSDSPGPWGSNGYDDPEADPNVPNWDRFTIVGRNQEIFKDYLRLTTEPKPEQIRPFDVLQRTLDELKKRWKQKPAPTYNWMCSQFKSLRQDLTVQRIKNNFTVTVYEIHARIALEASDMVEYNQCQATLKTLYEIGIPGNVAEFTAYRILMLLHGRNRSELNLLVGQLTPQQKSNASVRHALDVQRAVSMGNYHAFFRLFVDSPNMGGYIMDHFSDRERAKALIVMTKAYKKLPLSFVHKELAFDTIAEARDFVMEHKCAFFGETANSPDEQKTLDCKPAIPEIAKVFAEKYSKAVIKGAV